MYGDVFVSTPTSRSEDSTGMPLPVSPIAELSHHSGTCLPNLHVTAGDSCLLNATCTVGPKHWFVNFSAHASAPVAQEV